MQLFTTSERAQKERTLYVELMSINLPLCPNVNNLVLALEHSEKKF